MAPTKLAELLEIQGTSSHLQHLRIAVLQFGAHCSCSFVRRFGGRVGAAAVATSSQYWLEYLLARVWDYLISLLCCVILGERCATLCLAI